MAALDSSMVKKLMLGVMSLDKNRCVLEIITCLKKICNHPFLTLDKIATEDKVNPLEVVSN